MNKFYNTLSKNRHNQKMNMNQPVSSITFGLPENGPRRIFNINDQKTPDPMDVLLKFIKFVNQYPTNTIQSASECSTTTKEINPFHQRLDDVIHSSTTINDVLYLMEKKIQFIDSRLDTLTKSCHEQTSDWVESKNLLKILMLKKSAITTSSSATQTTSEEIVSSSSVAPPSSSVTQKPSEEIVPKTREEIGKSIPLEKGEATNVTVAVLSSSSSDESDELVTIPKSKH